MKTLTLIVTFLSGIQAIAVCEEELSSRGAEKLFGLIAQSIAENDKKEYEL